jgi:hypothetical protein
MAELKTKPTEISVDAFIDAVPDPVRRGDAKVLRMLMARRSGEPAVMWGPTIIGFGTYHYKYESGREGTACRIGFSPRKAELVLYLPGTVSNQQDLLAKLGKHKTGKGCLYVKKLADVDLGVVEAMVAASLDHMNRAYPD